MTTKTSFSQHQKIPGISKLIKDSTGATFLTENISLIYRVALVVFWKSAEYFKALSKERIYKSILTPENLQEVKLSIVFLSSYDLFFL